MKDSLPTRYSIIHNLEGFNINMVMTFVISQCLLPHG